MSCSFCSTPADKVLVSTEIAMAVRHSAPLTSGHTLVVSRRHVNRFLELDVEEQQIIWQIIGAVQKAIPKTESVEGFIIGFADFPENGDGHAHVHVVPRKLGEQLNLPEGIDWVLEKL